MIEARRLPLDIGLIRELAPRVLIILLMLITVAVMYAQPLWVFAGTLALVVLVAMAIDKALVIPIVIVAIPLEISKEYLPSIYDDPSTPTVQESILDAGRLAMLAAAALWVARARTNWFEGLPQSGLYLPLILLGGLFVFSSAYSEDFAGAVRDIFKLVAGIGLFTLVLLYVRDRASLDWALLALVGIALVLAMVGLYQQVTGHYFFNEGLANAGVPRRNATFFDPNIYARFLVVGAAVALGMSSASATSWRRYLMVATVVAALLALPFTSSRSNWVAAAVVLPLMPLALPIRASGKVRMLALGAVFGIALIWVVTAVEPALVDRIKSVGPDSSSLGDRSYLIQAGWQMFLDHPLFGVGLGSFKDALQGPYSRFIEGRTVLSHTSVITVMAELGLLGLYVLGLLIYRLGRLSWRLYVGGDAQDRGIVAGLVGAVLAIFVSSQSEGRFFDEPYLWLTMGLLVALAGIREREALGVPIRGTRLRQ